MAKSVFGMSRACRPIFVQIRPFRSFFSHFLGFLGILGDLLEVNSIFWELYSTIFVHFEYFCLFSAIVVYFNCLDHFIAYHVWVNSTFWWLNWTTGWSRNEKKKRDEIVTRLDENKSCNFANFYAFLAGMWSILFTHSFPQHTYEKHIIEHCLRKSFLSQTSNIFCIRKSSLHFVLLKRGEKEIILLHFRRSRPYF